MWTLPVYRSLLVIFSVLFAALMTAGGCSLTSSSETFSPTIEEWASVAVDILAFGCVDGVGYTAPGHIGIYVHEIGGVTTTQNAIPAASLPNEAFIIWPNSKAVFLHGRNAVASASARSM